MCFKLIRHKDSRWNSKHSISMDLGRGEWSTLQLRLISAREEADMKEIQTGDVDAIKTQLKSFGSKFAATPRRFITKHEF